MARTHSVGLEQARRIAAERAKTVQKQIGDVPIVIGVDLQVSRPTGYTPPLDKDAPVDPNTIDWATFKYGG